MTIRTPQQQHDAEHDNPTASITSCPVCNYERRRCQTKTRFTDRDQANASAQNVNVRTRWTLMLVCYPCPWCLGYHLTKARPGTARWRRAEKRRREWIQHRSARLMRTAPFGRTPLEFDAYPVVLNPHVRDGEILMATDGGRPTIFVGTRPLTDIELAGEEARWLVRQGLADVLAWLGQEVGPRPERTGRAARILERIVELAEAS